MDLTLMTMIHISKHSHDMIALGPKHYTENNQVIPYFKVCLRTNNSNMLVCGSQELQVA